MSAMSLLVICAYLRTIDRVECPNIHWSTSIVPQFLIPTREDLFQEVIDRAVLLVGIHQVVLDQLGVTTGHLQGVVAEQSLQV